MPRPSECTGRTARWCPTCGTCTCAPDLADRGLDDDLSKPGCPLHDPASKHAEPPDGRRTKSPAELAVMRLKAWETRRRKYGKGGHRGLDKGAYRRAGAAADPEPTAPRTGDVVIGSLLASGCPLVRLAWLDAGGKLVEVERPALVVGNRYTFAGEPPWPDSLGVIVNGEYEVDRLTVWRNPPRFEVELALVLPGRPG